MVLPRCAPWFGLLAIFGSSWLVQKGARADEGTPTQGEQLGERQRAAEALFDDGRRLMHAGHFDEACPKLKRSQEIDPGLGTLVNLGLCYEKSGRTTSAWLVFRGAASQAASSQDDERERYAREHADALEPVLARLVLLVSSDGTRVWRDGADVPRAMWGVDTLVDPGEHVIDATAEGRRPWHGRVVAVARQSVPVLVPELDPASPSPTPPRAALVPRPDVPPPGAGAWHRPVAIAAGSLGLGALAFGVIAGLVGISKYDESSHHCRGQACSDVGLSLRDQALTLADVATVSLVTGGVLLAGGVLAWVSAPRSSRPATKAWWAAGLRGEF